MPDVQDHMLPGRKLLRHRTSPFATCTFRQFECAVSCFGILAESRRMRTCADMPLSLLVLLLSVQSIPALQSQVGTVGIDCDIERNLRRGDTDVQDTDPGAQLQASRDQTQERCVRGLEEGLWHHMP